MRKNNSHFSLSSIIIFASLCFSSMFLTGIMCYGAEEADFTGAETIVLETPEISKDEIAQLDPEGGVMSVEASEVISEKGELTIASKVYYKVPEIVKDQELLLITKESGKEYAAFMKQNSGVPGPTNIPEGGINPEDMKTPDKGGRKPPAMLSLQNENSRVFYEKDSVRMYVAFKDRAFFFTDDEKEASDVDIYTAGEKLGSCITAHPAVTPFVYAGTDYETPYYTVSVSESADEIRWYVDGEPVTGWTPAVENYTADALRGREAGLYRVSCEARGVDEDFYHYRESSCEVSFIVTTGIIPDSFITFSDVHGKEDRIADAISGVMRNNGGRIPALVICTGDFAEGMEVNDYDQFMRELYPAISGAIGGIDTVYVSGNHERSEALCELSVNAGFGADEALAEKLHGLIYDGRTPEAALDGLLVYGINYYALEGSDGKYSYDLIYDDVKAFLEMISKDYRGELLVFSAHAGLHVLGLQEGSTADVEWAGEEKYNIDGSDRFVQLLNSYAKDFGLNIMFLFGHDHSKREQELLLVPGDQIFAVSSYENREYIPLELEFTYGQSGYLTPPASSEWHYSYVEFGTDVIKRYFNTDNEWGTPDLISKRSLPIPEVKDRSVKAPSGSGYSGNGYSSSGGSAASGESVVSVGNTTSNGSTASVGNTASDIGEEAQFNSVRIVSPEEYILRKKNGRRYYTDADGKRLREVFIRTKKGNLVYAGADGWIVKGRTFITADGKEYRAAKSGKIIAGQIPG